MIQTTKFQNNVFHFLVDLPDVHSSYLQTYNYILLISTVNSNERVESGITIYTILEAVLPVVLYI